MNNVRSNHLGSSFITGLGRESYLTPKVSLNFTYGYPEGVTPDWIIKYQTELPTNFLERRPSALIPHIESYFKNLHLAENVMLVPTASFAFVIVAKALISSPTNEIIIMDNTYDSYALIIKSSHGKAVYAERNPDLHLNIKSIREKITKNTKAIVLCMPENPLGVIYRKNDLEEVIQLCKEHEITLVIDYCFIEISPFGTEVPKLNLLENSHDLSYILIGDTGKILGLKGTKFGALLYSDNWKQSLESIKSTYFFQYNQYDLFVISQILTDKRFPKHIKNLNKIISMNYYYIKNHLNKKLRVLDMQGSCFCLLDITSTGLNDVAFAEKMRNIYGLRLIPASYFFTNKVTRSTLVRIALARSPEDVHKLVDIINKWAEQQKS